LNLTLQAREARGVAEIQWASVAEANQKIGKVNASPVHSNLKCNIPMA